jgi:hypothetical protein
METFITVELSYPDLVKQFCRFICEEFNIFPHQITIAPYEVDDQIYGLCIDESENEFLILVKQNNRKIEEIFLTIAHEMVHVKQYLKENLSWFLENRSYIPYEERWWEKEAFSSSIRLLEKFVNILKKSYE